MTLRQFGETAIKILGVYYAIAAALGLAGIAASLLMPQLEGFPSPSRLAAINLLGIVALAAVAAVCLLRAGALAEVLFSDQAAAPSTLSRRDWLFVGITLVGFVWAASGLPEIVGAVATLIWYVEGTRQPMLESVMQQSLDGVINAALSVIVGLAIVLSARRLSIRLDADL